MSKAAELAQKLLDQRIETIERLKDIGNERLEVEGPRGRPLRSTAWLLANHELSHTVQVEKTRQALGAMPSEVHMILGHALTARAALAAAMVGMSDEELERKPAPDQWSVREIVEHVLKYDPMFTERLAPGSAEAE